MPSPVYRVPELIAHRGLPRQHRENTLPGFLAATAAGADAWELDVQGTLDGMAAVHHDATLPLSSGALAGQALRSLHWAAVRTVTVGSAGETIPTLDDVLQAAAAHVTVYIEIKDALATDAVLACIGRHAGVRTAVHSFDHRVAARVHGLKASVPVGVLVDSYLVDGAHALAAAGARDYWAHRDMVDASLVTAIHAVGGRVIVWTVNDVARARELAALGVDAICSDVVGELREAFRV
jgi:glycerophosphoryl diester phosphodiesterase